MKKIIIFILSLIIFVTTIIYGVVNNYFSLEQFSAFHLVFLIFTVLFITVIILIINHNRQTKIKTLENRLTVWSNLSYYVNKIGDEAFYKLPIGIILYDVDSLQIKWNNPFSAQIFGKKTLESKETLKDVHPEFENIIYGEQESIIIEYDNKNMI